jgi:DNA-binding response OmpR family regulator
VSTSPAGLHHGAHIVVADEKPALLEMIVRTLRSTNHCVFQAHDGLAAFELTLALRDIDLLITDTRMPGLNGPALVRQVRAKLPELPILYIQNNDQWGNTLPDGLPADVPTLREPFTAQQLLDEVRLLLARGLREEQPAIAYEGRLKGHQTVREP